jgi:hypothetical protein
MLGHQNKCARGRTEPAAVADPHGELIRVLGARREQRTAGGRSNT